MLPTPIDRGYTTGLLVEAAKGLTIHRRVRILKGQDTSAWLTHKELDYQIFSRLGRLVIFQVDNPAICRTLCISVGCGGLPCDDNCHCIRCADVIDGELSLKEREVMKKAAHAQFMEELKGGGWKGVSLSELRARTTKGKRVTDAQKQAQDRANDEMVLAMQVEDQQQPSTSRAANEKEQREEEETRKKLRIKEQKEEEEARKKLRIMEQYEEEERKKMRIMEQREEEEDMKKMRIKEQEDENERQFKRIKKAKEQEEEEERKTNKMNEGSRKKNEEDKEKEGKGMKEGKEKKPHKPKYSGRPSLSLSRRSKKRAGGEKMLTKEEIIKRARMAYASSDDDTEGDLAPLAKQPITSGVDEASPRTTHATSPMRPATSPMRQATPTTLAPSTPNLDIDLTRMSISGKDMEKNDVERNERMRMVEPGGLGREPPKRQQQQQQQPWYRVPKEKESEPDSV